MSDTAQILEQAARWRAEGKGVALATVVTTWGSSPRPIGAKLAVSDAGGFVGAIVKKAPTVPLAQVRLIWPRSQFSAITGPALVPKRASFAVTTRSASLMRSCAFWSAGGPSVGSTYTVTSPLALVPTY